MAGIRFRGRLHTRSARRGGVDWAYPRCTLGAAVPSEGETPIVGKAMRLKMENYKGRHIGCAPGTHSTLAGMIRAHVPPGGPVLDLGAHSGAMLCRLGDMGYEDLVGADLDVTRFDVPGANFVKLELNSPFADRFDRSFRLVVATDVIEHLDSPREFLGEVRAILADDGLVALSFPNVAFWEGRLKFALTGELWGFGARNYRLQRHISPMTIEQTRLMLQELGFEIVALRTAGSFATPLKRVISAPLWLPLRMFGESSDGESTLVLARKAAAEDELKHPVHYRERWEGRPDTLGFSA